MNTFKIASCQIDVIDNKKQNIKNAIKFINKASNNQVKLITLPEMFNTPYNNDKFIEYAEKEKDSYTLEKMCDSANKNNIYLQAGSIPEKEENNIYNTAYLIDPNGKIIKKHRKMHMFDINTETMKFKESKTLTPGNSITTIKTEIATISLAICYDIRFPEMWTLMSKNKSDLIILPGAFNTTTGPAHWETLIKSRAIDTQTYIIATSPTTVHNPYYTAWGHSMIVDPWGDILAQAQEKEKILYATFSNEKIKTIREQLPILKNKRSDIYQTIKKV